jgi:amino acid adenylation domain-containing protein/non-ribosomal peptide synthase protein (TIGR01720 family)
MKKVFQPRLSRALHQYAGQIAIEQGNREITYNEIDCHSDAIAAWINQKGIQKESFIGIQTRNRVTLIKAVIGILKAAGVFVPIDTALPEERRQSMKEIVGLRHLLNDQIIDEIIDDIIDGSEDSQKTGKQATTTEQPTATGELYHQEDKIYIYFTSGTTGKPKAIVGKNKSLTHFIDWEIETFDITPGTRISQFTTPGFDAFLRDVFVALCSGGVLCIPENNEILQDGKTLINWIDTQRIEIIHCVPSLFRQMYGDTLTPDHYRSLKYVMLSGEKINPAHLKEWDAVIGDRVQLVNYYGPTETTMIKTYHLITRQDHHKERIPVGIPMKGCRVIILDDEMKICDENIVGEIYIRTPYRTHGYYNEEQLNRQRFIQNPFNDKPGDLIFRTGDQGRMMPDGTIDLLGRKDRQVKINGVRVELEEIEQQLLTHPQVEEAAVRFIEQNRTGVDQLLCADISLRQTPGTAPLPDTEAFMRQLRGYLSEKLPTVMIPAYIAIQDRIPRKPNGKIDYDALPDPSTSKAPEYHPPETKNQEQLVEIWQDILHLQKVGIHDSFFNLGGNSLNIMTLISYIHRDFGIRPSLGDMFEHDTVESQAQLIEKSDKVTFDAIEPAEPAGNYPVTPVQSRLFFLQHLNPENKSYNMPRVLTMEGDIDREKLKNIFLQLIRRHESLRTTFHMHNNQPVQRVHPYETVEPQFEVNHYDPGEPEKIIETFIRPFDLSKAPLMRIGYIDDPQRTDRKIFLMDTHHIISDGVSQGILVDEFMKLYDGVELPPLRVQYKDIAVWQNKKEQKEQLKRQEEWWLEQFSGELPLLNLPQDKERPAAQNFEGDSISFELDRQMTQRLNAVAAEQDVTLFILLLAQYNLVLSRLSGQEDIIVGTSTAGRRHPDKQKIIGMFVNNLALRNKPEGHKNFRQFLQEVKQDTLAAFENQEYQLDDLMDNVQVERVPGRNPLFDVMFVLNNEDAPKLRIPGLKLGFYPYEQKAAQMDQKLRMLEIGGRISCHLEYSTAVFDRETAQRFTAYIETAAAQLLLPGALLQNLAELEIMPPEEKRLIMETFNCNQRSYPQGITLHEAVRLQAQRTPHRIAVTDSSTENNGRQELTYRQLDEQSHRLAILLRKNGITTESVVGVMMDPAPQLPVTLLAVLKAGAAYLPIETDQPIARIRYMLEDAGAQVLITDKNAMEGKSMTAIQGFERQKDVKIALTPPRPPVTDFNRLPMPDRTYINMNRYKDKIGMASVSDTISIQATRGCPYECVYCHKVWSKKHTYRDADNIYDEVNYYYKQGVRNFAFIDDCFNLHKENSTRFFKKIIQNRLDLQIFFPNGLRGDLLTPGIIDLMVEAGTRGINLSLETASPRLQKLLKKYLDIEKFRNAIRYIAEKHPDVILEIATMHGFPTETEEEAYQTLDFIKEIKWLHFPYIHILKIFPNTEMEALALEHGVPKESILASKDQAFHELPETLPFPKRFTREYQADYMKNYFLNPERLRSVIPVQQRVMGEAAMLRKYDSYLPQDINRVADIAQLAGMNPRELEILPESAPKESANTIEQPTLTIFQQPPAQPQPEPLEAIKILLLDLSQHYSSRRMLYNVVEQPLGPISLLTYLKRQQGDNVAGKILKAGVDFDSFEELHEQVTKYQPDLVGIRTLTYYKEFFHETVSHLRQVGIDVPIIAGGPYATSDYDTILKDPNVDIVVLGEGEVTLAELVEKIRQNHKKLPDQKTLADIAGIAYRETEVPVETNTGCRVLIREYEKLNRPGESCDISENESLEHSATTENLAYVMYTSGSTGTPKGVMVEHRQVQNCIHWMQETFKLQQNHAVVQRTNMSFDPSVWEIFWPLAKGARVEVMDKYQRKDADYLIRKMAEPGDLTVMYTPATMVGAMTYVLESMEENPKLKLPQLLIGAEPISRETVKTFYKYYDGQITNTYGPTETTINNTYYRIHADDPRPVVPIGKPVANNTIYILSPYRQPVPLRVPGEIWIAGQSVARGYIGNEKKTAENFIDNPFGPGKLYKTGDIGRWLTDGNIEIMGRRDEQVKIRGHRIELGEIESALATHSAIRDSRVIAWDNKPKKHRIRTCKRCGIDTGYPGIRIDDDGLCGICENVNQYKRFFEIYFKEPDALKETIRKVNEKRNELGNAESPYDCLLLYAGGRAAGYALYRMKDMGLKILAATYDNGYFSKREMENIKRITESVGVPHVVLTHTNSDKILKESMETAHTVCRGCFHVSSSLALEYAHKNGIPVVVGATLSRGQIIENKLFMFAKQGITDPETLENEILKVQRSAPDIDRKIYDLIDIESIDDRSAYENVVTLDFYRYVDITNRDMIRYLHNRDSYWKTRKDYAIYSTNCSIKQIGDYGHRENAGYHYYGSATSWEKRLGHITLENHREDLQCNVTRKGYERFLERVGAPLPGELAQRDEKFLVAYIAADEDIDTAALKTYLADRVPRYMIPSHIMQIEAIPLTINGKLDRDALPVPEQQAATDTEYVKPEGQIQQILAQVWHDVLGVPLEQIGQEENFFQLGGDSIKAIQITARLQAHKLKLDISQIFQAPTISQLAPNVKPLERTIPQEPVAGECPLTPIQHSFFQEGHQNENHYNQSVMFYRKDGFERAHVETALKGIAVHHDALRMHFPLGEDGQRRQNNRPVEEPLYRFQETNLENPSSEELRQQIQIHAQEIQRGMNLETGPLLQTALFKTGRDTGDHLLLGIHHQVVDGISWRIIMEDFEIAYLQAREGQPVKLRDKTDSFKTWAQQLQQYAQTEKARIEIEYWKAREEMVRREPPLPRDFDCPPQERVLRETASQTIQLEQNETEMLLKDVNHAYNTEINDILLTALGLAVSRWAGTENVPIRLEGHGREPIIPDIDISRTVGWFTSRYPVCLPMGETDPEHIDIAESIKNVKETLRQIPNKGIGYGILRNMTNELGDDGTTPPKPEIEFNYLGQFGRENGAEDGLFQISPMPKGDERCPQMHTDWTINVNGMVADGKLGFSFAYNKKEYRSETVGRLAESYRRYLQQIVAHCSTREETEMTVSDYDAVDLDNDEMEAIYDELELD